MVGARRCLVSVALVLTVLPSLGAASDENLMVWNEASNPRALCNDYSRAGYFLRRNPNSSNWIIFLESGSLCFSNETCNRRFFRGEVRPPQRTRTINEPFGNFDTTELFNSLRQSTPYRDYINPSMTSMKCLNKSLFRSASNGVIAVEGRDILSPLKGDNEDFYAHNHVLIPYCSSDLWLLGEAEPNTTNIPENVDCNVFNGYVPNSPNLQFAFRGRTIFESIFQELLVNHGMNGASSLVLSGSSAGGVGATNLAQWVRRTMPSGTKLRMIVDSAWFINFQNNIANLFEQNTGTMAGSMTSELAQELTNVLACNDTTFGYPCCFSTQCVLTRRNESGHLAYFPEERVDMFFITSRYDTFILAPSLLGRDNLATSNEQNRNTRMFRVLNLAGEYGGEMASALSRTYSLVPSFTYYLTQCFQHIYFTTSTLWGRNAIFGTSSIGFSGDLTSFIHTIEPGRWNIPLASGVSMREAIHQWYTQLNNQTIQKEFRDSCNQPYCNDQCPERFTLGELTSNDWPLVVKIVIAAVVAAIGLICVFCKFCFKLWLLWLEKKQDNYLEGLDMDLEAGVSRLEFPVCEDDDAIAVACLDLNYTISFEKSSKKVKDERSDKTEAVVLGDLEDRQKKSEELNRNNAVRSSRRLRRRSRIVRFTDNVLKSAVPTGKRQPSLVEMDTGIEMDEEPAPAVVVPVIQEQQEEISSTNDHNNTKAALCGCREVTTKHILKDISIYFNPGEMIGIMGPSGCGKTTFMDLLTGRRKKGTQSGTIYINGTPMNEIRDWYIANTGYVLQLARPYYEELTVRDNLTLAAEIKLPVSSKFTTREKFMRVEQVLEVTGLSHLADTVVGGETGPGLSGGQKRRLVVALQLLRLPSVIFLDEPTSGLDATSSMELLSHLNKLADSNRTVILTIHQPRLEIFHMFHKLVLLSDGKVAYHGAPEKSYEVFVSALRARYLEQGLIIPSLEDHNPADVIMDMLGNPHFREVLTRYYHESAEPKLVRHAIKAARLQRYKQTQISMESFSSAVGLAIHGARKVGQRHANIFVRLAALEARAIKRLSTVQIFFLPMVFFAFGLVLGTVYFQQSQAFLIISGMCVFSVSSGIFVFPAIEPYFTPAIRVYQYERADGIGRAQDLIFQGFIRYISVAFLPVIGSTALAYFLLINRNAYDPLVFFQVVLVNLCLNFTWTALLIALIVALPKFAFRLSSTIASIAGFTSGFFIPINNINWAYRWIAFINPNYYGLSAVAFLILEDYNLCTGNQLTCYLQSGAFTLRNFFFDNVNPYLHIMILLGFTLFFLCLGILANWLKDTSAWFRIKRIVRIIINQPIDELTRQINKDREGFETSLSTETVLDENENIGYDEILSESDDQSPLLPIISEHVENENGQDDEPPTEETEILVAKERKISQASSVGEPSEVTESKWSKLKRRVRLNDCGSDEQERPNQLRLKNVNHSFRRKTSVTPYLLEGQAHCVWLPKKQKNCLSDLVVNLKKEHENRGEDENEREKVTAKGARKLSDSNLSLEPSTPKSLRSRQQNLFDRLVATRAVLKETTDEILKEDEDEQKPKGHISLFEASKKVSANIKKQKESAGLDNDLSNVVSQYLQKVRRGSQQSPGPRAASPLGDWSRPKLSRLNQLKRQESSGAIPIATYKNLIRKSRSQRYSENITQDVSVGVPSSGESYPRRSKVTNLKREMADKRMIRQEGVDSQVLTSMVSPTSDGGKASGRSHSSSDIESTAVKREADSEY